jgi:wyosine [tRNA(Phe)-imidazoG37] synthetase (radical SAM superfamily)
MTGARSCVYGPVASRRLGRSLGIDLVPLKTCTFDCVYSQLGPTTHKRRSSAVATLRPLRSSPVSAPAWQHVRKSCASQAPASLRSTSSSGN